jgi:hypothetical protein
MTRFLAVLSFVSVLLVAGLSQPMVGAIPGLHGTAGGQVHGFVPPIAPAGDDNSGSH